MKKVIGIVLANILVLCVLVVLVETGSMIGLSLLGEPSDGWMVRRERSELDDPCRLMITHPILSHVHDHRGQCRIKGGYAEGTFVYYDPPSREGRQILVALGGSTTDGFYQHYADGDTYPYLLDRILESRGIDVVNGGTGAYGSTQELLKLVTEVPNLDLEIRHVVSLSGINDLEGYHHTTEEIYRSAPFMTSIQYRMFARQTWFEQGKPNWLTFLPSTQGLLRTLTGGGMRAQSPYIQGRLSAIDSGRTRGWSNTERWFSNVKTMKAVSDSLRAHYHVLLQPVMGLDGVESVVADPASHDAELRAALKEPYIEKLNETYAGLKQFCRQLPYCHDLTDVVPPTGDRYADPKHLNGQGNRILAEEIAKLLFPGEKPQE